MKKISSIVKGAFILSAALLLTACSSSNNSKDKGSTKSNDVTIMAPFIETEPPAKKNAVLTKMEEMTGKKININWVINSSYEDKTNITLASDNIPQVMVIQGKTAGFIKSANSGAFWDLTDYLPKYTNLGTADPDITKNASVNGKVYGIYRGRDVMRTSVTIRKDWLEKLGLKEPETVDDLYNIAKEFTENDPDGNGKKDTYGLVIPKWPGGLNSNSPYDTLATWFGAGNAWHEVSKNKLEPTFMSDKYLDSMKFVKKMIDNGYVNEDFATLSSDNWDDPFVSGKGGIIIDTYSRTNSIVTKFKEKNPDNFNDFVTFTGNLKDSNGKLHALPTDGYSGFLAIPKASVKTEKELKEILTFLNKLNSKKANVLLNNGIEDVNFTVDKEGLTTKVLPETSKLKVINNAVKSYSQLAMSNNGKNKPYVAKPTTDGETENFLKRQKLMASDTKSAVFNPAASIVTDTYSSKGAQLDQIISDARIKYFAGQINEKGWHDAINLWKKSGGNTLIQETNKIYAKIEK